MDEKLEAFEERFKLIQQGDKVLKQSRLLTLLIDLREVYDIPKTYDAQFNQEHSAVVDLYRRVRSEMVWA